MKRNRIFALCFMGLFILTLTLMVSGMLAALHRALGLNLVACFIAGLCCLTAHFWADTPLAQKLVRLMRSGVLACNMVMAALCGVLVASGRVPL